MSATAIVFVALFFVARYLGWIDVFRYLSLILGLVHAYVNRYLNKRYGQLGANEPATKIGKIRFTTLLMVIIFSFMMVALISGFMNFPGYYLEVSFLIFIALISELIVWTKAFTLQK